MTESQLIIQIAHYLDFKNLFFYRNNTGAVKGAYTNKQGITKFRFMKFGVKGMPDYVLVMFGRYIGIEAKKEKNKQSEYQIEFEKRLKAAGGEYWLIYDIDQLIENIRVFEKLMTT